MDQLAPVGPVYQAGTLSGNPIAMACGLATLELIAEPHFHTSLARQTERLCSGLEEAAAQHDVALKTNNVCGMFSFFFTADEAVSNFSDVTACDGERFKQFFQFMLGNGVNLAPSPFESGFVSSAHGDKEIENTIVSATKAFKNLSNI